MLFLVLKIDGREGFAGSSSVWHSIRFGNWPQDLAVPFADDSMEGDEEQDADCVFCAGRFSEDHNGED